jgi:SAM-dependent methyltransferase
MREAIKDLLQICVETIPIQNPIYEFGSYLVPGQEKLIDTRPFFAGMNYFGADMREGPGVDTVLNLHEIDLPDASVGTVVMIDTLEHVEFVRIAINEVHRILKTSGVVFITSVMDFPIHAYPNDYWRFTPEGFRSLLSPFPKSLVTQLGRQNFPHTLVGVGFKENVPQLAINAFKNMIPAWERQWKWKVFRGWKECVRRIIPPIILEAYLSRSSRE